MHKKDHNIKTIEKADYWKAIREADCVFVYTVNLQVRRENVTHNQHWELPKFVKSIMRPNAKMIAQYDI